MPPFSIYLIPYGVVGAIINLLGIFGNANIIVATIRRKKLNNKCNYLIGINAAFDFYTQVAFMQVNAYALFSELIMPNDVCFKRTAHMNFSMNTGTFLVWTIGVDRLLAIKFPTR